MTGRDRVDQGLSDNESGIIVTVRYTPTATAIPSDSVMTIKGTVYEILGIDVPVDNTTVTFIGRSRR